MTFVLKISILLGLLNPDLFLQSALLKTEYRFYQTPDILFDQIGGTPLTYFISRSKFK